MNRDDSFYAWAAQDATQGSCGVTAEPDLAQRRIREALARLAPDAAGMVEKVRLDRSAHQPSYIHVTVLSRYGAASDCGPP
ncbi:hypothetical protein [Nonomuraea insulae]|uniref:Uncharacterized protein n=1 Tax=Nonomuraea insulae TaxID=1616787 RepID=A0ABW1CHW7_9ACTN